MNTVHQPEVAERLTIAPSDGGITVIERVAIEDAGEVRDALTRVLDHIHSNWSEREEYRGALLFSHREEPNSIFSGPGDVSGIAVYSRWQHAGEPPVSVPEEWSVLSLLPDARVLGSRTYTLDFSESLALGSEGSPVSKAVTPFAHMGIFTQFTAGQEPLLAAARQYSAESLSPEGVVAVNFVASVDEQEVINLGQWKSVEILAKLALQPRFAADDNYWDGLSDFEGMFFDLVAVDPGPSAS